MIMKKTTHDHNSVLFISQFFKVHEFADFEVMDLDACLRSTSKLAQFANNCGKILEFISYSTFPSLEENELHLFV